MLDKNRFCIIGGDVRQVYLGELLIEKGYDVTYFALEKNEAAHPDYASLKTALSMCGNAVLPTPLTKDGKTVFAPLSEIEIPLDETLAEMLRGKRVFTSFSGKLAETGDYSGCDVFDYLACEELAVKNAAITAEGAVGAAIGSSDITLWGSRCLVAGFGRIGKALARRLQALGADVTVAARKESDLAWVYVCGFTPVETSKLGEGGARFDFVFNTIPCMIFTRDILRRCCERNAVVTDLASKPGGVDIGAARDMGINAFAALALPGKTAPKTAAGVVCDVITRSN